MAKPNIIIGVLLSSLLLSFPDSVLAAPEEARWAKVNLPAEGKAGNWVLASGSDIQHLTMAIDGTLYSYANPTAAGHALFKSTDNGSSWSDIRVTEAIVALATVPDDAHLVYYATNSTVYRSQDAGTSFVQLPPGPGGAGSSNITITSIALARLDGDILIAVATKDLDNMQYGGVYTLKEGVLLSSWVNTNLGSYDVVALAFSPHFAADRQLVAVATNGTDTIVTAKIGDGGWGQTIGNATIKGLIPRAATIAFPDDYDAAAGDYSIFVAIDTGSGNGDVYQVNGARSPNPSLATDLNIGAAYNLSSIDTTGLALTGNTTSAHLLAGTTGSTEIYSSNNSGSNWTRSAKKPTGQSRTSLMLSPDFTTSSRAYATTSGNGSAFSATDDGGVTWNQLSLIDAKISEINDLAVSPEYNQDGTLFLVTADTERNEQSLWRRRSSGANWERVFHNSLADANGFNRVQLSPQYSAGNPVMFLGSLSNTSSGNSVLWKSTDNGRTFTRRGTPFPISTWLATDNETLLLGSYNGTDGLFYRTTDGGTSYNTGILAGSLPLKSIAVSPGYPQNGTILVGNSNGWVYWSADNGSAFAPLPADATTPPLTGEISVVFEPDFSKNNTVYATSNQKTTTTSKERVYRFIIGSSERWESIDSTLPLGSILSQPALSNGVLYIANQQPVNTTNKTGGIERSLNPTYSLGPIFETVTSGLENGATLTGLWVYGNRLWASDSKNTRLMTYVDSLALPVTPVSPADETQGLDTSTIRLDWKTLEGATQYQWQLDSDTDFSSLPAGFDNYCEESSARLPPLEVATTYYWRVRATKPVISPWSAKWSFTTILGTELVAPKLYRPEAAATHVPVKPIFQWNAFAGADGYELLVATNTSFAKPVIALTGNHTLPATAWQSDIALDYDTTYFWKVRASGTTSRSAWSAVGAFTTEPPPKPSPASTAAPPALTPTLTPTPPSSPPSAVVSSTPTPPSPSAQNAVPAWVIYLGVALLLTTVVLLVVILLVLVVGRRAS